jgi:GT2 family glycosyltransferase
VNIDISANAKLAKAQNPAVMISILNWNTAPVTLQCVNSLLSMTVAAGMSISIVVIDNGSNDKDWRLLHDAIDPAQVTLLRQESNLGFAGGHNIAMRMAIAEGADFIWLVNSDAVIDPDCLEKLLALMAARPDCGATSPVIVALDDENELDFCGAMHDWKRLETARPTSIDEARRWEREHPEAMWVAGTVVLYRVEALRQIGILDEALFAYYEDTDIGARLSQAGWLSLMAFDARARHLRYQSDLHHRPPYYFYLMTRNGILFWMKHTPAAYRGRIRLRLLDRSLFLANILVAKSQSEIARACMLGALDGMRGKGGPPRLERRVPSYVQLLRRILLLQHARHMATK